MPSTMFSPYFLPFPLIYDKNSLSSINELYVVLTRF